MTEPIRINFSENEAESQGFELIPAGKYVVAITNIDLKESKSEKNFGKPFWAIEFTVQEGPYEKRKLFSNVMLFEGALYSLAQMMKAVGLDLSSGEVEVPGAEWWLGQVMQVRVVKTPARTVGDKTYDERNDIKGFYPLNNGDAGTKTSKANSLLP